MQLADCERLTRTETVSIWALYTGNRKIFALIVIIYCKYLTQVDKQNSKQKFINFLIFLHLVIHILLILHCVREGCLFETTVELFSLKNQLYAVKTFTLFSALNMGHHQMEIHAQ